MIRTIVALSAIGLMLAGCNSPDSRLNAPPHGRVYKTNDLQGTFTYMIDNAALADMTVSDMHFLPHRALLNDLGVQRLARLAELMDAYGGVIRFDTNQTDEDLVRERTDEITSFLKESGIDTTHQVVMRDLPGGDGAAATEAILIKAKEGTYDPKKKKSESGNASGAMAK